MCMHTDTRIGGLGDRMETKQKAEERKALNILCLKIYSHTHMYNIHVYNMYMYLYVYMYTHRRSAQ